MEESTDAGCRGCGEPLIPGARFCPSCGTPTSPPPCASCGEPLTPGARFCASCGNPVVGTAPAAAAAAAPAGGPVAERRITSVLFGDLVGFTTLSESRDPEEVRELLSRYFAQCRVVVGRYGGTIEKFIGDAVMAVWGVPVAHEDDAERAVRAGLELVEMVTALGEEVGAPGLSMRVGVVTGEVAVTVGATNEGMVAGDAVNTASRVQSTASPGEVWVDDTTRSLTIAAVAYEDTGEHALKGKAEPMRLFAARAVVAELGGGQRVDGLEAPHTGRDRDLRLLKELFHATEEAGRPRLVVVDGEPGVGKSRLVWEFEKYLDGLTVNTAWHRGRCLSYGDGVAFWALTEAVRTRLGLTESDQGGVVTERLDSRLAELVPDTDEREWLRPRLAGLVGAGQPNSFARDDLFAAWTTFFERVGASSDVVVLVLDDAHYADDGLLDFVEHLLETSRAPIFVLAVTRPELLVRRPGLGGRRATVIRLEPLVDDDMRRLVDGLVDGLPATVRDQLVQRAEGVPLFAVETVRALIDRDAIVPRGGRYVPADGVELDLASIGAPASLQALVAARLDALAPDERRVVNDASVLGVVFTRDGVAALAGPGTDIDAVLDALRRKEIVGLQTDRFAADRGQFRFVQAVVRQVAYSTQSRRDRKQRHLAAADHLSTVADDAGDLGVVIAQHLLDALESSATGDPDIDELRSRACAELERAAQRAHNLGAPEESRRLLLHAVELTDDTSTRARLLVAAAQSASDSNRREECIELCRASAAAYEETGDIVRAGVVRGLEALTLLNTAQIDEGLALASREWERLRDVPEADEALLSLCRALASGHRLKGDLGRSAIFQERRVLLAERLANYESLSFAFYMLAQRYSTLGAPKSAEGLAHLAYEVAREHDLPAAVSTAINLRTMMALARDLDAARELIAEGLTAARRCGDLEAIEANLAARSLVAWFAGDLVGVRAALSEAPDHPVIESVYAGTLLLVDWAEGTLQEPLEVREWEPIAGSEGWGEGFGVLVSLIAGRPADGTAKIGGIVDRILTAGGLEDDFVHLWPWLVETALAEEDTELVGRLLEPVVSTPEHLIAPLTLGLARAFQADLGALQGEDARDVQRLYNEGVARLEDFGAPLLAARARARLGRWLLDHGRSSDAEAELELARAAYREHGALGWLRELDRATARAGASA